MRLERHVSLLQNETPPPHQIQAEDLEKFQIETEYSRIPDPTCKERIQKQVKKCNCKRCFYSIVPAAEWLQHYNIKMDLVFDLIAGVTVAILNVPQSLAYAMLAYVPAHLGLYMSFFPPFIYFLFGTSRQCSIGTFAIVCLLTGKVVLKHSSETFTPTQVGTACALTVGIFQVFMYTFQLGFVSRFLSHYFISGFVSGAALNIYLSQIPELLGLELPKRFGIPILMSYNIFVKPRLMKKTIFPIPIDLIFVIITILISYYCEFKEKFHVRTVGFIPAGIPAFEFPNVKLMPEIILESFGIALVSYALLLSVGMLLATKHFTKIDSNQEALAMGLTNIFSSCFHCIPCAISLSRTLVQDSVGGRTQLASVFSALFVLIVVLKLGTFFEPLPKATLAVIIVVALRKAVAEIFKIREYWRLSKLNSFNFIITFAITLCVDIELGLFIGLAVSFVVILYQGLKPYTCLLGATPHTDVFLDIQTHKTAKEIPKVKIFHYAGSINFAQGESFQNELYTLLECDPIKVINARKKELQDRGLKITITELTQAEDPFEFMNPECIVPFQVIILDFSAVTYIDPIGVEHISIIAENFKNLNVPILLACPSDPVFETLKKCDKNPEYTMYPTIKEAVKYGLTTNMVSTISLRNLKDQQKYTRSKLALDDFN
ncbi:solute carrier family 26 member 6-like [Chrysoperla carnea]|uniref:solute carrier family 26 member 6-like n=1 Tax=Chrysoperla carnea TaxID=189513 RepID=UPI001D096B70|nr:solute carrier family 26 member 6-like [Chrysoperla carnea]